MTDTTCDDRSPAIGLATGRTGLSGRERLRAVPSAELHFSRERPHMPKPDVSKMPVLPPGEEGIRYIGEYAFATRVRLAQTGFRA